MRAVDIKGSTRTSGSLERLAVVREQRRCVSMCAAYLTFLSFVLFFLVVSFIGVPSMETASPSDKPIKSVELIAFWDDIPAGALLSKVPFRRVYLPEDEVPHNALRSPEQFRGFYSRRKIYSGQPVVIADLATFGQKQIAPLRFPQ